MKYRRPIKQNIYINNINNLTQRDFYQSQKIKQKTGLIPPPVPYMIQKDINLREIFNQMLNLSNQIYQNKNESIYIKLTEEQLFRRKIIIESIKKFVIENQITYNIFYNIIFLFDLLMARNKKNKLVTTMEKIGLGSAILMIKFNFLENRMVCMKKYKTIFNNKYYSTKEVTQLEILCLMLTNYDLNLPTPSSFMEIFLLNKIIFYMDYAKKETRRNIYNLIMNTLENILFESNEYIKYNPLFLCCCIVCYSREMLGIEKWPRILAKLFNANFQSFEMIYNEYFKLKNKCKEMNNRSNNYDSSYNNISTNIDSHGNYNNNNNNNSNGNDKITILNNNNFRNCIYNNILNNYRYRNCNNYKIGIKKINLNISQQIINNIISSEMKRKRYNNSVDMISDTKERENSEEKQELSKEKALIYGKRSKDLLKCLSSRKKENKISLNYYDKLNTSRMNPFCSLIKPIDETQNNINPLFNTKNNENNEKEKQSIKNIKINIKPFLQKHTYRQINKKLDIFLNTEANNNNNNNSIIKKTIKFNESRNNNITSFKELNNYKNENYSSSFHNNINKYVKRINYKRYSSCDMKNEEKVKEKNLDDNSGNNDCSRNSGGLSSNQKLKNFSIRRNYCYLKKLNEKKYNKEKERESEESPWKNSFIYNRINNNQQIKKRNENKTHYVSRSIENLENKNRDFNYKNNNHINSVIFENDNLEEENNKDNYNYDFKSDKKSSNRKCYRWSSLDKFCDHKKDSNENIEQNNDYRGIKKIKNIRNFYKQRNINYSGV